MKTKIKYLLLATLAYIRGFYYSFMDFLMFRVRVMRWWSPYPMELRQGRGRFIHSVVTGGISDRIEMHKLGWKPYCFQIRRGWSELAGKKILIVSRKWFVKE